MYNGFNEESQYPQKVDELIFYQDVDLAHLPILEEHEALIQQKQYTLASEYLQKQTGYFSCSAGLFNLIQNRIKALQDDLLATGKKNPHIYSELEPKENVTTDTIWIDFTL